ncbi:Zn(II)2Cys6 transcription factor domain-containing protein [Aspergillus mulundensis]|uniref:Putative Zn(II)2Cys6 transcription factor n=1 Tax=Aspergillus mulundensis TaxID=1810919 RepID=A0A3D8QSL4_9EURO|nr:putative Zn(II)2Cys6 transcription factor [Aspergillus mulundensis]RDW64484.1 putative Zn(II)2Cys6 transcription factor [Aspergillus mulundensis]
MTTKAPATSRRPVGFGPLKSRRGCKTCKARKIKCGEEKPFCLRCTKTGRDCQYTDTAYGTFSSASAATTSTTVAATFALSPTPNRAWRERRAFAYYSQHAAPILGGLDAEFWGTIVPRICHSEPAVWDAIISISSLFENYTPSKSITMHQDALGWYLRSVSAVRQQIERGVTDVFVGLISCVLFICIEALQGSAQEAIRLYHQGTQLALALRDQIVTGTVPASKGLLLEDTIVPIFARLSVLADNQSKATAAVLLREIDRLLTPGLRFASLKAAREAIFVLTAETQLFQAACEEHHDSTNEFYVPDQMMAQQLAILSRVRTWQEAFTALTSSLQARLDPMSPQETTTIALLSTHYQMLYVIIVTCITRFKISTDSCLQNFQIIVEQSRIALDASLRSNGTPPPFTFDIGVGVPLWFAVLRCADPLIRREAIALLAKSPQVQGFYPTTFGVSFAQAVIDVEEMFARDIDIGATMSPAAWTLTPGSESISLSPLPSPQHSPSNSSNGSMRQARITASDSGTGSVNLDPKPHADLATVNTSMNPGLILPIPEEARIKPYGVFIPRNGIPPGTREEDVKKWNVSSDTPFLQFSRNRFDHESGRWRVVDEVVPVSIEM